MHKPTFASGANVKSVRPVANQSFCFVLKPFFTIFKVGGEKSKGHKITQISRIMQLAGYNGILRHLFPLFTIFEVGGEENPKVIK